ncbi:MAG: Smr/MutS family protein [Desulfobacterales bacterium]|nr:Smr/MutS family protein [Desulfobacterales bacterium]
MEPIVIPIEDVIDLHLFRPAEVADLLDNYFRECVRTGIWSVRVIHGKGKGILKKRVLAFLEKHPLVDTFSPAPPEAGGWGATIVTLHRTNGPPA